MNGPRRITIGRNPTSDLLFRSKVVSLHHATLERGGDGWIISDCGSRNGTWVNGRRIQRQELSAGDRVSLGSLDISDRVAEQLDCDCRLKPGQKTHSTDRSNRHARLIPVIIAITCVMLSVLLGSLWLTSNRVDRSVAKSGLAVGGLTMVTGATDTTSSHRHRAIDLCCEVCFDRYGSRIVEGSTLASSSSVSDTTGVCPQCTKAKEAGKLFKDLERVGGF